MGSAPAAAATLAAALLVLAGCTASPGSGTSTDSGLPTAASSPTAASTSGGSANGASTQMTPPSSPATTTPATPTGLPGGSGDTAALAAAGELTEAGLVDLHGGPGPSKGEPADLCGFLFGTPEQVATVTRLPDDLALDAISGRHRTDGPTAAGSSESTGAAEPATVIACVYASRGTPVLALQVGDGPPVDSNLPGHPIIVDSDGLHAVLSYSPDHIGPGIEPATARAWLTATIARVAPAGTGTG